MKRLTADEQRMGRAVQTLIGLYLKASQEPDGWHVTEVLDGPDSHPDFTLRRGRELLLVEAKGKQNLSYTRSLGTHDAGIERGALGRYVHHSADGTIPVDILFYIVDEARLYGIALEKLLAVGRGPLDEAIKTDWTRYSTWFTPAEKMDVIDDGNHLRTKYEELYRRDV